MKTSPRILVIDDEPSILDLLSVNLRARGYDVDTAASGEDGIQRAAAHHPDLILLDLGLPGIDGVEVVRRLRTWTPVPVITLSARGAESDKVVALDAGADDYVTKPFGIDELLARVRAALRRVHPVPNDPVVATPDFTVDLAQRTARRAGEEVHLTPREWAIVEHLVRHAGRLVTQRDLLQQVWGPQYEKETNYLRVYLTGIRKKLEPDPGRPCYFITEPGVGYRFVTSES